jgi:CDP-diacylglycerol--glycerol-3-phosphate 3-phosphatidyltransferase
MRGLTLPNVLTGFRLAASPALVALAALGLRRGYWWLLGVAFATDAVDGFVARRLGSTSEAGARLDSRADLLLWSVVPPTAWWLWPERIEREAAWLLAAAASYLLPLAAALLRFRRVPSFHAWAGKAAAVAMSAGTLLLLGPDRPWTLRLAALLQVLAGLEETAMVLVLPAWRANVPSLWHALRITAQSRSPAR